MTALHRLAASWLFHRLDIGKHRGALSRWLWWVAGDGPKRARTARQGWCYARSSVVTPEDVDEQGD